MYKVIIAGCRDFDDYKLLEKEVKTFLIDYNLEDVEIVSGCATGADTLGEKFAEQYGCKIKKFKPDWNLFGNMAGIIRNSDMSFYSDACICFWNGVSKGTKNMIEVAMKTKLNLKVIHY